MLFPVRCFTCNKAIGGRHKKYVELLQKYKGKHKSCVLISSRTPPETVRKMAQRGRNNIDRTAEAMALDALHLNRYCCRRHFMCDIDVLTI